MRNGGRDDRASAVPVPDVDSVGRYTGALLQYRGTTLADLYQARTHLEVAAVETLGRKRSPADLRRLDAAIVEGEARWRTRSPMARSTSRGSTDC